MGFRLVLHGATLVLAALGRGLGLGDINTRIVVEKMEWIVCSA